MPVLDYRYGEYNVFSRFDFMGRMMLAKLAEMRENKELLDSDIEVYNVTIASLQSKDFMINYRNRTIDSIDGYSVFRFHHRDTGLVKKVLSILRNKRKNSLPKMHQFNASGVNVLLTTKRATSTKAPEFDGVFFSGTIWVDHLIARGLPRDKAIELVSILVSEVVNFLQTNRVK